MLYLLYLRNGFIKKFPLNRELILLGRTKSCDFYIDESFVSKKHAKIVVNNDYIEIEDLGSTNGTFVENNEIAQLTRIDLNQSFRIGHLKFFLKKGNPAEFDLSDKVKPLFKRISNALTATVDGEETNAALNILYTESLVEMLQIGFSLETYGNFFKYADKTFKSSLRRGCLLLISKKEGSTRMESQWNYTNEEKSAYEMILKKPELFRTPCKNIEILKGKYVCTFPVQTLKHPMALIYIKNKYISAIVTDFLEALSVEIGVIYTLIDENRPQEDENGEKPAPSIVTKNQEMLTLLSRCKKIAVSNLFVLIEGETGTGKELLARFIHHHSKRRHGNFIALNCAAIPENLMEVELFGHEKGAFTDASGQRKGMLEMASDGTLVLDEIGDMPLNLQAKLLRTIQEGQFYRVGGTVPIKINLRIICMTNKNVKELMTQNQFREDLYYRIAHVTLKIPPLRERKEDIASLIDHFITDASKKSGIFIKGFSDRAVKAMEMYDWPGNVREFENEMFKVLSLSENDDIIDLDALKEEITEHYNTNITDDSPEAEKAHLLALLKKFKWNKTMVAKELNYSRTTLYEKLKKFDI